MRPNFATLAYERVRKGSKGSEPVKFGGRVKPSSDYDKYDEEIGGLHSTKKFLKSHSGWREKAKNQPNRSLIVSFLRKNINRPWNKVYSEFCQLIDGKSTVGSELRKTLKEEIILDSFFLNGKLYHHPMWRISARLVTGFYVHTVTGLLLLSKSSSRLTRKKGKEMFELSQPIPVPNRPNWFYKEFDGVIYRTFDHQKLVVDALLAKSIFYGFSDFVSSERKKDPKFGYKLERCSLPETNLVRKEMDRRASLLNQMKSR